MRIAKRLTGLTVSETRIISEGALPDAIPLGVGEPTWALPEPARKVLKTFSGACSYGPGSGLPELRRAIAAFYQAEPEEVLITCGTVGALFSLLQAWVGPGDRVLMPDPGYVTYRNLILFAGGQPLPYPLSIENRFRLDADELISRLDQPGVKVVILNHPSNPTGGGTSADALRRVAMACQERKLLLISDEVYRDLYFGERPPSLRDFSRYGIVVNSVSKGWGAPGLRIGWALGDPDLLAPAQTVHSYAVTSPAIPAQKAAAALLEASDKVLPEARKELIIRWEALQKALKKHRGLEPHPPDGTFYYWMTLPKSVADDPVAFCLRLRDEAKVVVVPGLVFGERGRHHVRLSFAASPEQISEGIRRLAPFWDHV